MNAISDILGDLPGAGGTGKPEGFVTASLPSP